jgi:hypothetical protein
MEFSVQSLCLIRQLLSNSKVRAGSREPVSPLYSRHISSIYQDLFCEGKSPLVELRGVEKLNAGDRFLGAPLAIKPMRISLSFEDLPMVKPLTGRETINKSRMKIGKDNAWTELRGPDETLMAAFSYAREQKR